MAWPRRWDVERRGQIMAGLAAGLRDRLVDQDPVILASRCGADYSAEDAAIRIPVLGRQAAVLVPQYSVVDGDLQTVWSPWLQNLVLMHLVTARGTPLQGRWVTLREIPNGRNYSQAMQSYAADRLAKHVLNDLATLRRSCTGLGGAPLGIGDAGFEFAVFPRVPVGLVYWAGDEEFPPSATILFDAAASDYLPTDALAVVGNWLCSMLVEVHSRGQVDGSFFAYPFADLGGR